MAAIYTVWLAITMLLVIHKDICTCTTCGSEAQTSQSGYLQSTSSLAQSNRKFACKGESITFSCTLNGTGLVWESNPPLGQFGMERMFSFIHDDPRGTHYCYILNYICDTMLFASAVLEYIDNITCTSSMTLTPVASQDGILPTFNESFAIFCNVSDGSALDGQKWLYEVAAFPDSVNVSEINCTYYQTSSVVVVEITQQDDMDRAFDLAYYEVTILNDRSVTSQENVLALPANKARALFYPVKSQPQQIQVTVVTVDMCNQRSQPIVARCSSQGITSARQMSKMNFFVFVFGVFIIQRVL